MARRPRSLTEADQTQWAEYASSIQPLGGRAASLPAASPVQAAVLPPQPTLPARRVSRSAPPSPLTIGDAPGGVDKATWQRFRSGKLPATRKLDLHGQTAQHAHHSLIAFLRTAHADRLRCVEVVTGRGSGDEGGVIRREFRMWLNLPEIRSVVLAAAHPHAANPGAVRLLLRRAR
jgi:DNA-nicking Smr family endonuclease